MTRVIDLHVHTTASDGTYSPADVVKLAGKAGLAAVAITDHDTVDGVEEALKASDGMSLEVVPGVEISVGDTDNIHIIGLYVNIFEENFKNLMDKLKASRNERNHAIIENIRNEGYDISCEKVKESMKAENIGRLHIAHYLQKRGYFSDYRKAFKKFLIPESKTYVPIKHVSEEEGIQAIIKSGGLPFLAHINYLKMSDFEIEKTVKRLIDTGLAGIEVFYSGYNKKTEAFAHRLCDKYDLLKSGGTDFHGARRPGVYLGTGRGNLMVPHKFLLDIKKKLG